MIDIDSPPPVALAGDWPADADAVPALPAAPKTLRETGLEQQLIVELIAKAIFLGGRSHLSSLASKLRLSLNVLREALAFMVAEQLAEVSWRGESDIDVQYQLSGVGKERAGAWLERRAYVGPAPVTLAAYHAQVERQSWRHPARARVSAADIAAVYGADHLDAGVLQLLGAALYSGRSIFLHGPSGGGKTALAAKLGLLLQGLVGVPYAVMVGQEIIQVHDPLLHPSLTPAQARLAPRGADPRWALCQRPAIQIGAELSADMLELRHDAFGGCYQAPPHFKANNGIFIIDDLGRQRLPAAELLNRFMQPLDAGHDQLSLRGGHKFTVPFDVVLVLVTNLAPAALLDDAFLRRLGYKIHLGALDASAYRGLFRQQCRAMNLACDEAALAYLLDTLHGAGDRPLLASHPRELLGRIVDFAG
ncbi:MAG TPA: ATPase, partial [Janthinobacterium sp.]|nr:ATPase [Janthinobacterium sp.]